MAKKTKKQKRQANKTPEPSTPLSLVAEVWRTTRTRLWAYRWGVLAVWVVAAGVAWGMLAPMDDYWMHLLRDGGRPGEFKRSVAEWIGGTGDWLQFQIVLFVLLWIGGKSRPAWRRAAVAGVVALAMAGLTCNVLRPVCGRPRPSAQARHGLPDTFHPFAGFAGGHAYQSFPSAHAATAFAFAVPVLSANPLAGVACLGYAGTMAWARVVQNAHHPSDVWMGAAVGVVFGWATGRKRNSGRA